MQTLKAIRPLSTGDLDTIAKNFQHAPLEMAVARIDSSCYDASQIKSRLAHLVFKLRRAAEGDHPDKACGGDPNSGVQPALPILEAMETGLSALTEVHGDLSSIVTELELLI